MPQNISYNLASILNLEKEFRRNLINCLSGFKSVCLCGSINKQGITNLSVISSVIHVGANPPLIGMLMRPHTVRRDTIENIDETKTYTLNHIHPEIIAQAHQSSAKYPQDISEFEAVNLSPQFTDTMTSPYVSEALIKIGLTLEEKITLKSNATILIVGKIREIILPENIIEADGFVNLEEAKTVTVSGLDSYHVTKRVSRLPYARTNSKKE